jgi:hypothetical protein
MNEYSIAGFQSGDGVIAPDKLELTDAELLRAQAQEQSADDPAPEPETLMRRAFRFITTTFSVATPLKAKWPEQDAHAPDYRHMSASAIGRIRRILLRPVSALGCQAGGDFRPGLYRRRIRQRGCGREAQSILQRLQPLRRYLRPQLMAPGRRQQGHARCHRGSHVSCRHVDG